MSATRARRSRKRRRDVFLALCALAVGSLALGMLPGMAPLLSFHVGIDALLGLYTVALLRRRPAGAGASMSVPARRFAGAERGYDLAGYALASGD